MAERSLTFRVRVRPGAKHDHVGGTWGEDVDAPLNVWVARPAVDGAANKATVEVLAAALKVRRRQLSITSGGGSRIKTVRVEDAPPEVEALLQAWRAREKG